MEFHQVKYFLAVCNHMNFTRAAESCSVSQPALTVAIQKLEANLGGALFLREGRKLSLTCLGQAMQIHLSRIEETRHAAYGAAAEIVLGEMKHIELGIMCTIGPLSIGPALSAWQSQVADVELILHDVWGQRAQDLLLSGMLDCALIARQDPLPDRFDTVPLMSEAFELVYGQGHSLSGDGPLEIADLNGQAYLDRLRCEFRKTVFEITEQNGLNLNVVMRSEREDWIQNLIATGMGISLLPRNSIIVEGLSSRPVNGLPSHRTIEVVTVRGRPMTDVVRRFVDFMGGYDWNCIS